MSPVDKLVVRICFEFNVDLNDKPARTHQILKRFRHIPISLDDYDYIHHTTPWLVGAFFVHLHIILYNILPWFCLVTFYSFIIVLCRDTVQVHACDSGMVVPGSAVAVLTLCLTAWSLYLIHPWLPWSAQVKKGMILYMLSNDANDTAYHKPQQHLYTKCKVDSLWCRPHQSHKQWKGHV